MVFLYIASNPKAVATTKAIFGICVDPCNPYRIATYAEVANCVIWLICFGLPFYVYDISVVLPAVFHDIFAKLFMNTLNFSNLTDSLDAIELVIIEEIEILLMMQCFQLKALSKILVMI